MGLLGKIATLASVGLPAKAAKNAIAGRAASTATKTTGAGGTPPPPPPPGAGGAGGAATKTKTMTGGTGGFTPSAPPPPPKAGQNVYAAGQQAKAPKAAPPAVNVWQAGKK